MRRIIVGVRLDLIIGHLPDRFRFLLQRFHFAIERRLQLARRAAELGQRFSNGPTQLRQFLRAEDDQRQEKDEDRFLPAQRTHR